MGYQEDTAVLKIIDELSDKKNELLAEYKSHIREKAIKKAKVRITLSGGSFDDYSMDDLEIIVKEEEDTITEEINSKGLYTIIAFLGFGIL